MGDGPAGELTMVDVRRRLARILDVIAESEAGRQELAAATAAELAQDADARPPNGVS